MSDARPVFNVAPEHRVYEHVREGPPPFEPVMGDMLICRTPRRLFDADPRSSTLRACTCGERLLRWSALPSRWRPPPDVPSSGASLEEVERFLLGGAGLRTEAAEIVRQLVRQIAPGPLPPPTPRPAAVDLLIGALRDEVAAAQMALISVLALRARWSHLAPPPPEPPSFLSEEYAAWRRLYGDTP